MPRFKSAAITAVVALLLVFALWGASSQTATAHQPTGSTDVSGNVTTVPADASVYFKVVTVSNRANEACAAIGTTAEFAVKLDSETGSVSFDTDGDDVDDVTITVSAILDTAANDYTVTITGGVLNDVIAKSGSDSENWYHFDPGVTSATPLFSSLNKEASHWIFCFDAVEEPQAVLDITKTASATYDCAYTWTIEKSVSDDSLVLHDGGSATVAYTITVDKSDECDLVRGSTQVNRSDFRKLILALTPRRTSMCPTWSTARLPRPSAPVTSARTPLSRGPRRRCRRTSTRMKFSSATTPPLSPAMLPAERGNGHGHNAATVSTAAVPYTPRSRRDD